MIRVFVLGDVIGRYGRGLIREFKERIANSLNPDIFLVNGENAAGGFGLTFKVYQELTDQLGVDCITMGNHWHDKKEILNWKGSVKNLVLPANMANIENELDGLRILQTKSGVSYAVINVIGQTFMKEGNRSPFDAVSRLLPRVSAEVKIRIVDIHAEATSEKQAMAHFLKDRVSLVYGTHSHVPTADERILTYGSGFVTDVGSTGGYDSVVGMEKAEALKRMLTKEKIHLSPAKGDLRMYGIYAELCELTGRCLSIARIFWPHEKKL